MFSDIKLTPAKQVIIPLKYSFEPKRFKYDLLQTVVKKE
ncbi:hypothetical protein ADICYQ_3695 [Cyclobacterium qasimii M12-11B]|uniref:Uncharacterized protein n=1 Tax=Cyclobacterium qasimii M12-11B TaxID=641524 RepID=S7WKR3_9BACT|nr:hypothetical protein ADICYQ_3695 [Cyclobacterium qasimii M12-11B]